MSRTTLSARGFTDAEIDALARLDDGPRRDHDHDDDRLIAREYEPRRRRWDQEDLEE